MTPQELRSSVRGQEPCEPSLQPEVNFPPTGRAVAFISYDRHLGYTPAETLTPARIAFSIPYVNAVSSDLVCGPLFASYPHDLQIHPVPEAGDEFENIAHVGAPTVSMEVKLVGVDDTAIEKGKDPVGEVYIRGPPAGTLLGENNQDGESWLSTGYRGKVQPNGCFKVVPHNK